MLSRLDRLKRGQLWHEAAGEIDIEFQRLLGSGAQALAQLSETELLAQLIKGEPTLAVRTKTFMVAALFKEAGEVAASTGHVDEARSYHLKGLHLLLNALNTDDPLESPEFVPRIDAFLSALQEPALPLDTQARLMQHFERIGEFGKAEDWLYSMLETAPENLDVVDFGVLFYRRLQHHTDAALASGNLPRPEVDEALKTLLDRRG